MVNQKNIEKAVSKAKLLKEVLEKLKATNPDCIASINKEIVFISNWADGLNSGSEDKINDVWREVQSISKIVDSIYEPKQLSAKKDKLINEFWEAMLVVAADLRKNK